MGYEDGLGSRAHIIVAGQTLTREQTNEVMMRTNYWSFTACNDAEWEHMVASILGWYERHEDRCDDADCVAWWTWVRDSNVDAKAYGASIGALDLGHLNNEAIMSLGKDEPDGWLRWDGTVGGNWTIGGYPEVDGLEADLAQIAAAFPFLRMLVQVLSGGFSSSGVVEPEGTVVAEWRVHGGDVTRLYGPGIDRTRPRRRLVRPTWAERWERWKYGDTRSARAWRKVTWSKAWRVSASPYWAWCQWRHRASLNSVFFPRDFDYGMAVFAERHVSAARLIEADDQMRHGNGKEN